MHSIHSTDTKFVALGVVQFSVSHEKAVAGVVGRALNRGSVIGNGSVI
jgi:hypothetical protein